MSTSKWMALSLAIAVAVVALLAWQHPKEAAEQATVRQSPHVVNPMFSAQVPGALPDKGQAPLGAPTAAGPHGSPLDAVAPPVFKVDDKGALVLDSDTRDNIDMVASLYDRAQAMAKLAEATKDLSPAAQRQVTDLYEHYVQYSQAVKQAFPAEQQTQMTLAEAQDSFAKLQQLRQTYLGDQANALFGRDDAVTKTLFAYSGEYLKAHPEATLEEAAMVAQERFAKEQDALQAQQPPAAP